MKVPGRLEILVEALGDQLSSRCQERVIALGVEQLRISRHALGPVKCLTIGRSDGCEIRRWPLVSGAPIRRTADEGEVGDVIGVVLV